QWDEFSLDPQQGRTHGLQVEVRGLLLGHELEQFSEGQRTEIIACPARGPRVWERQAEPIPDAGSIFTRRLALSGRVGRSATDAPLPEIGRHRASTRFPIPEEALLHAAPE